MKTRYYIASIVFAALVFTSCEKSEFSEIMEREVTQEEARHAGDADAGPDAGEAIDPEERHKKDEPARFKSNSGVVKEVSDGDEESDDDDNTAS